MSEWFSKETFISGKRRWTTGRESLSTKRGGDFVAQERVSMRKIKEILRLHYGLGLRQDQIARSCQIGQATVHRYLERFAASGVGWPLSVDWDNIRLEQLLFGNRRGRPTGPMN